MRRFVSTTRQGSSPAPVKARRKSHKIESLERRALLAAVAAVSPTDLSSGVPVNPHVGITFDGSMQRASLTSSTIELLDSGNPVATRISYNDNSFIATIDPSAPLAYDHTYTVLVHSGPSGVQGATSGALASDYTFSFTTGLNPTTGSGGPILVITSSTNPFSTYYPEILRAEGLNEFATADISTVTESTLQNYKVAILSEMTLTAGQATDITNWVTNDGGKLIAMRPDHQLAGLFGLTDTGATINDTYLDIDNTTSIGGGITSESMQYHGTADRYSLNGATQLAALFSNSTTATGNPAVTTNSVGTNGGQAAAFVFDLAKSVIETRQGNPAYAGQERDGDTPIRSDDLFYPDFVDFAKIQIPQADEQQRLLANMINQMTAATNPLPRFWYLPNGNKAEVVMTGDDHNYGGTAYRWSAYLSEANSGGQPIRGTSYMYSGDGSITDSTAAFYQAQGFDPSIHIEVTDANDNPRNFTSYSDLDSVYTSELASFESRYVSIPSPRTARTHAIVWSDYDTQPQVEYAHNIRLDTNYYYYPASWIQNRPGLFTGSAMPMRFAQANGTTIDVFQATTQLNDENGADFTEHINTLLDNATGSEGYYGVFTVNAHTDLPNSELSDDVLASARAHNVPVITAEDLLDWTDARDNSSFSNVAWNAGTNVLTFNINTAYGAAGLQSMVPFVAGNNQNVSSITVGGNAVSYTVQTIKGIQYAFFNASTGAVSVQYGADTTAPTITSKTPADNSTGVGINVHPTVTVSEDVNPSSATFTLTDSLSQTVSGAVSYNPGTHTFTLTPTAALQSNATYTLSFAGAQDTAGNTMAGPTTWTFTTAGTGPFNLLPTNSTPHLTHLNDASLELGVKFTADFDGYIGGLRFYKDPLNTSTHTGTLWTSTGTQLATGTFTNETDSGWQTLMFSEPVHISANTVYIASYHTATGYSADQGFYTRQYDNLYLHAPASSAVGGNGVFRYGSTTLFPNQTFDQNNYWIDVIYSLQTDFTLPTVTANTPSNNATNVALNTAPTATFSKDVQPGSISFVVKDSQNNTVAGTIAYDSPSKTATFTPSADLSDSQTYTATVDAEDFSGNPLASPFTWSFATIDTTPPTVTSVSPANGAGNVAVGTAPTATFSEAVQSGTISFVVTDPQDNPVPGTVTYDAPSRTATFTPTSALVQSTVYTATVSGAQDSSGNTQGAPFTWSFTTADTTAPTVTVTAPLNGATNVATNAVVTATFSEDVQSNTISFVLKDAQNNDVPGAITYDSPTRTATFTPAAALSESSVYTATVSNAQDLSGNTMNAPVSWSFTTADTTPPTVTDKTPSDGATDVPTSTALTATFSEDVQSNTISFIVKDPQNNTVPGTVTYDEPTKTATFTPTAALDQSTVYTATVSGAQDLSGNAMSAPVSWSFTTATADTTAPTVTSTSPVDNATNVALGTTISATFSEDVQSNTISFVVKDAQNNTVPGTLSYDSPTTTATFTPDSALTGQTTYTVTISGAQDLSGNAMSAPVSWSFTTADTTAPTVATTSPIDGATGVSPTAAITASFSEDVQSNTISFVLKDSQNNSVPGTVTYDAPSHTATFTPTSALDQSTVYTATVSGAQDLSGNTQAAPSTWSFTTADTTAPAITATAPLDGATGVASNAIVTATFSEDVQSNTISFVLKDSQNNLVPGTITYDAPTKTATFTPTASLNESATYTATVSGAQDLSGNAMGAPLSWSFTTGDATAPSASAGTELPSAGASSFDFTVTFTDDGSGLDASTFDNNDITVTGPNSFSANATFISLDNPANGSPRTATYRISAPGGTWDLADNGTYTIALNAGEVKDVAGNAAVAGTLRTFDPALPFAYQSGSTVIAQFHGTAIAVDSSAGDVTLSDGSATLSFTGVTSVNINGTDGDDTLNFAGPVTPAINFASGAGNDTLNINSGTYTLNSDASATTSNLSINVNAGATIVFNSTQHLAALNISDNAAAVVTADGSRYLQTNSLSIASLGALDLNDNDLVAVAPFSLVQQWVFDGFSSTPDASKHGIISTTGQNAGGSTILALLDNAMVGTTNYPFGSDNSIPANAIIGKYTYLGDTNWDGQVTPDDYGALDANLGATGVNPGLAWSIGDTNFDGNVTPDDYGTLDANLGLGTGAPLAPLSIITPPQPATVFSVNRIVDDLI